MTLEVPVKHRRPRWLAVWPEMERSLDRLARFTPFSLRRWPRLWAEEEWFPDVDVFERDGKVVVRADVPGMKPEYIEIAVEGDILTISGKREEEKEIKEEDYYCSERSYGEFSRAIRLPAGVGAEDIEAKYENGVLELTVPRPVASEAKAVKVPIK